jgi:hypothetical protein
MKTPADMTPGRALPILQIQLRLYTSYYRFLVQGFYVPSRRLEDKIRHVCSLATVAESHDAWLILSELRTLLHQHIEHLRMVAAGKISGKREFMERRLDRWSA